MPNLSPILAPGSLLGQLAPANTTAAAIFTAKANTEITLIVVCNTTGSAATFRIFHDVDGTTYAASNALYYDVSVAANTTTLIAPGELGTSITLGKDDSLGVRTGTNDALTFSVYGVVQNVAG